MGFDRTAGCSDSQPACVVHPAAAVPILGRLIHQLVKCREDIVCKLYLRDRLPAHAGSANAKPDDSLGGQGKSCGNIALTTVGGASGDAGMARGRAALACSHSGVLNTRSLPYLSCSPTVHRNTPPKPTSSPKQRLLRMPGREACGVFRPIYGVVLHRATATKIERNNPVAHLSSCSMANISASFTALHKLVRRVSPPCHGTVPKCEAGRQAKQRCYSVRGEWRTNGVASSRSLSARPRSCCPPQHAPNAGSRATPSKRRAGSIEASPRCNNFGRYRERQRVCERPGLRRAPGGGCDDSPRGQCS